MSADLARLVIRREERVGSPLEASLRAIYDEQLAADG